MANNFLFHWKANAVQFVSGSASPGTIPTTNIPCVDLDDTTDERFIVSGHIPASFTGSGTLKMDIVACANTTTAADDAQIDVATEHKTAGAGEALNSANFDATPDSGTFTFSTTAYSMQKITITLTPAVTPVAGDKFRYQITRDANHASLDSLVGDLKITDVWFYEEA